MTDIPRSVTKRLLRGMKRSPATARLFALGIDAVGYRQFTVAAMEHHAVARLDPVFEESESQVAKPRPLGSEPELHTRKLPPIQPLLLENVQGQAGSSIIRKDRHALFPKDAFEKIDRLDFENEYERCVIYEDLIALKHRDEETLAKGICAFGHGDSNWYHWVAEILPVVFLSQNLPPAFRDYPLLVPEAALKLPSFVDALNICRGERPIVALQEKKLYRIGEMMYFPPPVSGPFNMKDHNWPEPVDYTQNIGFMHLFRGALLNALEIARDDDSPKRVFLARKPSARSYNQDEIIAAARERGFEPVRMETLSFREQVHLMHNAHYVIGPSGAAFANTLFMKSNSHSLVWALREYGGGCFFSNLAHVAGNHMTYCFVEADSRLNSSHQAFHATYHLPVEQFCHHVDTILSESLRT